jgi:protein Hikeshi
MVTGRLSTCTGPAKAFSCWAGESSHVRFACFCSFVRLSNEKPSAIFRLRGTFTDTSSAFQDSFKDPSAVAVASSDVTAMIGLAIEPLSQIQAQLQSLPSTTSKPSVLADPVRLAEKIAKNLLNYISSFTGTTAVAAPQVPVLSLAEKWYENFNNKIRNVGIGFLERDD